MYIAEIDAVQELLPLYEKRDDEARAQAQLELTSAGITFETQLDRLIARQQEIDNQQEQAEQNAQFLKNFRMLLPQPKKGAMYASSDDEFDKISKNIIWDSTSPSYLIGRLPRIGKRRYGRVLLDHTIRHSTGPEGIGVVRLHHGDVDAFMKGTLLSKPLDEKTANEHFDAKARAYKLTPDSTRSIKLIGAPKFFQLNGIRESLAIKFDDMRQYTYGKKNEKGRYTHTPAIPDVDLRSYEVMHHIALLAANFGLIGKLGDLLEDRKETALEV